MDNVLMQSNRELLIEWLYVATGQKRRLWEKYDVNVIGNSTLD